MAKAKVLKGKDLMLFLGGKATALATNHKLSLKADTTDAASKDDGIWDESIVTKMSWEASTEALYSADKNVNSYESLFDLMIKGDPVDVVCGVPANAANELPEDGWQVPGGEQVHYKGKAIITSLECDAANGSNAKMSVSLKGVGALTKAIGG